MAWYIYFELHKFRKRKKNLLKRAQVLLQVMGKKIYEDKFYIILEQNVFRKIENHDDYITIPKGCIIK